MMAHLHDGDDEAAGNAAGELMAFAGLPGAWFARLIRGFLRPSDRRTLFQTNKQLRDMMLGLSETTTLRTNSKEPSQATQELAGRASSLHIRVNDGLFDMTPLAHCITSVELVHVRLELSKLTLDTLPRLRTLTLTDCQIKRTPTHASASSATAASTAQPCNLQHLHIRHCVPKGIAAMVMPLINPTTLHTLCTDDSTTLGLIHTLPNLKAFTLHNSFLAIGSSLGVKDLQLLQSHPSLTHITLPSIELSEPLRLPCAWDRLELLNATRTSSLANLQLAGLQQLVLNESIHLAADPCDTLSAMQHTPYKLRCQPETTWMFGYGWGEPVFRIHGGHNTAEHTAALTAAIAAVGSTLQGGLCLSNCVVNTEVLHSLSKLPPGVKTFVLDKCTYGDALLKGSAVAKALPPHIRHIAIRASPQSWSLYELRSLIQNVQCFTKVTLFVHCGEPDWQKQLRDLAQSVPGVSLKLVPDMC